MYANCYLCGQPGHRRADCPKRKNAPVPAPADAGPGKREKDPALIRRPASEIAADCHAHAHHARVLLAGRGCVINQPEFRAQRLRRLAREQVAESRARLSASPRSEP